MGIKYPGDIKAEKKEENNLNFIDIEILYQRNRQQKNSHEEAKRQKRRDTKKLR